MSVARGLVLLAAALLALPGLWVTVKGIATLARRRAVVQGRPVTGVRALGAGLILVVWGLGMIGFAVLVVLAKRPR